MRTRVVEVLRLPALDDRERQAVVLIGEGVAPRDVSERIGMPEPQVYRLVVDVLNCLEPTGGPTLREIHAKHGSRPVTVDEIAEFEEFYGRPCRPTTRGSRPPATAVVLNLRSRTTPAFCNEVTVLFAGHPPACLAPDFP